jgi:tetratricopeptide (TPR) repeat protein
MASPLDADRGRAGPPWALAVAALALGTALLYARALGYGFSSYDDELYVTANEHVKRGLTWAGIAWAFAATEAANWHPLTWLSHMLDVQLFGVDAGAHRAVNVAMHAASAALLALVLARLTAAPWRSLAVAALFAVHPLRVESVAWISERKDVLSTLLWIAAMGFYGSYVRRPSPLRYAAVAASLALGLMAKPAVVTLPFALLLLDVWPLGRLRLTADGWRDVPRLVLEKLPLLALSAASSVVTVVAQSRGGAVASATAIPFADRAANAVLAYVAYLGKTVWPADLALLYPHPALAGGGVAAWRVAAAGAVLVVLSAFAVAQARRRPYLAVGWCWYLGTLVPVIGLVQVGMQGMADRYTYVPHVGLLVALVWGAHELTARAALRPVALGAAACAVAALSLATWRQVGVWKDDETLFGHSVAVTGENSPARAALAAWLGSEGRAGEALPHAREAVRIWPGNVRGWQVLSAVLRDLRQPGEATVAAQEAVRLAPSQAEGWRLLGLARRDAGDTDGASQALSEALRREPDHAGTWMHVASIALRRGRADEAARAMREAVKLDPGAPRLWFNLGVAEGMAGRPEPAIEAYREAVRLDPGYGAAWTNLAVMLERSGRPEEAARAHAAARRSSPGAAPAPR